MKRKFYRITSSVAALALALSTIAVSPQRARAEDTVEYIGRETAFSETGGGLLTGEIPDAAIPSGFSLEGSSRPYGHDPEMAGPDPAGGDLEAAAEMEAGGAGVPVDETTADEFPGDLVQDEASEDVILQQPEDAGDLIDRIEDRSSLPGDGDGGNAADRGDALAEAGQEEEKGEALAGSVIDSGNCGANLDWSLTDGGILTVSGTGDMEQYDSDSFLPPWSEEKNLIRGVVIGEGVASVGSLSFYGCPNLASLQLSSSVRAIEYAAFYQCRSLSEVNIPAGVTEIGYAAFADCTQLAAYTGGENVTTISNYAFQGTSLSEFAIPGTLTVMGGFAFYGCESIERFTGESSVYQTADGVLFKNNGESLCRYPAARSGFYAIPYGVTTIEDAAFITCSRLTGVEIPGTTTSLGSSAFQGCTSLRSIRIPDSVTFADDFTFYECSSLESVQFGAGLKTAPYEMFMNCSSLTEIDFGGVEELANRAFFGCTGLAEVTIPASVKSVGGGVFYGCSSLETVEYLAGCDYIPEACFAACDSLRTVVLKEGIKYINAQAFYFDGQLAEVALPSTVIHCVDSAFPASTALLFTGPALSAYGMTGYILTDDLSLNGTEDYEKAYRVLDLVNQERTSRGLGILYMDEDLLEAAAQRSAELAVLFSHTRPSSTSCSTASSKMTAENIAAGQKTAEDAMNSWMNSQGHRENILGEAHASIGIGCFKHNGTTYWVQCFGDDSPGSDCPQPQNATKNYLIGLFCEDFDEYVEPGSFFFGDLEHYTFNFRTGLDRSRIQTGEKAYATLYVVNGNSTYATLTRLNNSGFTWETGDDAVATVSAAGEVTGKGGGTTEIFARLANRGRCGARTLKVEGPHEHSAAAPVRENEKPATCTSKGSYDEVVYCSICREELSRKNRTVPATGHRLARVSAKAATTKAYGNIAHYKCTACKKLFKDKDGATATTAKEVRIAKLIDIGAAKITGIKNKTYTGKALTQNPKVVLNGASLKKDSDYKVSYKDNTNAGKAAVTITGRGKYGGSAKKTFTIDKAPNPLKTAISEKSYRQSKLSKEAAFNIGASNARGKITYAPDSASKKAKIKVSSSGNVTVPKKCGKGTYKITVRAAGNGNYKAGTKTVTIRVK